MIVDPYTLCSDAWFAEGLECARPRLHRLAAARAIPVHACDDVVQEALLEAWRCRDRLRDAAQLDVWLDGIARNVCRRWERQAQRGSTAMSEQADSLAPALEELPDPAALDLTELLDQRDLAVLLDKALGYLAAAHRAVVAACYLHDLPQREAAAQLGISLPALEARLHRARLQLQHVLSGPLRVEAEAFGLPLDQAPPAGWRVTREWCMGCGQQRLWGAFLPEAGGTVRLVLRCPTCSLTNGNALSAWLPAGSYHAFRPAIKRAMQEWDARVLTPHQQGQNVLCPRCGHSVGAEVLTITAYCQRYQIGARPSPAVADLPVLVLPCEHCGELYTGNIASGALRHPDVQRFCAQHPRAIADLPSLTSHAGGTVLAQVLRDATSTARLTVLVHPHSTQPLAVLP